MKKEIFIIDDDPIYAFIVSKMINRIDSSLVINQCENGKVGLTKLEYLRNSSHKIVVFLDLNMPILDGWEFLEEIEKCNFYNLHQLIIYIVSSSTDQRDKLKAKQFGFVRGFFHKPLFSEDIKKIIEID